MPPNNPASLLMWKIRDIQHRHMQRIHHIFEQHELHFGQPRILRMVLQMPGASQRDIARELNITPASLAMSLKRMQKNGLIEKESDDADQRVTRITLTDKGARMLEASMKDAVAADNAALAGLDDEEQALLTSFLDRIYNNLCSGEGESAYDSSKDCRKNGR